MTRSEFKKLRPHPDKEALCHAVHDEAGDVYLHKGIDALTTPQLTAYCVEVFFGLTCDGGFQSFFYGAFQWTVPHTVASLRRAGLTYYADVLERAIGQLFPGGVPTDDDVYEDAVEHLYEVFEESDAADECDDPFEIHEEGFWTRYNADEDEFRAKLHAYIVANSGDFITE